MRIWQTVEGLKLSGARFEDAIGHCARLLSLPDPIVAEAYGQAEAMRGAHKRRRRNLEIARRAAAGETHAAIAAAVGLKHRKSVARIIRCLLELRAFDVPGRAPSLHDGSVYLTRVALSVKPTGTDRSAPPGEPRRADE